MYGDGHIGDCVLPTILQVEQVDLWFLQNWTRLAHFTGIGKSSVPLLTTDAGGTFAFREAMKRGGQGRDVKLALIHRMKGTRGREKELIVDNELLSFFSRPLYLTSSLPDDRAGTFFGAASI